MARLRVLDTAVRANTKNFERGMKRAGKSLRKFGGLIATVMGVQALRNQAAALDKVAKASDRLGISTENLISFHHAAELTGTSVEAMDKALELLARRMGEVKDGSGEAIQQFNKLGLDAEKMSRMELGAAVEEVAAAMERLPTAADKASFAADVFGRSGVSLLNFLNTGREGIRGFHDEAKRLNLLYSREELAKVERANDMFNRMGKVFKMLGSEIVIFISPLVEVIGHLTGLADAAADTELGILGLQHTVLSYLRKFDVGIMPGKSMLGIGGQIADIERRIHELNTMDPPKAPAYGAGADDATGKVDTITTKVSNLEQTAQSALGTLSAGFDVVSIKAQGFNAVLQQVASSLASMASQTFAQYLLSEATSGFVPNPLSLDQQRAGK